jgi:hypothetical protein
MIREALMQQYRVVFTKRLCNDVGVQRNCIQAIVSVRCSKSEERAIRAAQKRFERSKRIPHWSVYADNCETLGPDQVIRTTVTELGPALH